ncbi:hypothetical protein [Salinibacterium sp. SWN248]|uniref:hypothetical protein n=1 Tax=Salinibacterium sp. SWN248 TaxID=2792056 RepID=UPI0018CD9135|nr:hypothetical protein [Salinibacterium sp. SWN248]MBH0022631.1 hypothetical protein [Salinibacterium sp. SWN248]
MPLDARTLLSGPRGRRLCLAVACLDPRSDIPQVAALGELLFYATYNLETARGQGGTMFGWGAPRPLPEPSVEEIVDALNAIPLTDLSSADLLEALAISVDSARYWQEPDGSDELLSDARLATPLQRIAEHTVASPSATWLSSSIATEQWAVTFRDLFLQRPPPPVAALALKQWHTAAVEEERIAVRDRPSDATAALSGTWWSRPPDDPAVTTRAVPEAGPVGVWLVEDRLDSEPADAQRVHYAPTVRVFEILGSESWAELCRSYPLSVTAGRRHDWYQTTGRIGEWMMPNWSLVARDYDAVHLSVAAYLSSAGIAIPVDDDVASVIAGWNPDETYWLTDVVRGEFSETSWMRDERTLRWHPIARL